MITTRRASRAATAPTVEAVTTLKTGALQNAILNSANFSSIATDAKGVIQIFNVGAERMLGYAAAEVMNKITPADISDPQEVIARAKALSVELGTPITPGFEALVFKASRGIEDIYELTYIRKDGSRFPAVVSVTALRDAQDAIIGYLLIGTDNTARKQVEEKLRWTEEGFRLMVESVTDGAIVMLDSEGRVVSWNTGVQRIQGYSAEEIVGQHFSRFYPPDDIARGAPQHDLDSAAAQGRCEVEGWRVRKDGSHVSRERGVHGYSRSSGQRSRVRPIDPGPDRAAAGGASPDLGEASRGKGQPREIGVPVQHEPRAALTAQCDPRVRSVDGIRRHAADTVPEGEHRRDSARGMVSPGADQRDSRSGADRVREAVAVAGADVTGATSCSNVRP